MFGTQKETKYLKSVCANKNVLEWGCGESTVELSMVCKSVTSIEHNLGWYNTIKGRILDKAKLYHVPQNKSHGQYDDGNFECYRDYVMFPIEHLEQKIYDVIFIDGRARYYCAETATKLSDKNTRIIIHDFMIPPMENRQKYAEVKNFLRMVEHVDTLGVFKIG